MSSKFITNNVFVPSIIFPLPLENFPTPRHNLPISVENDLFHVSWSLGCFLSCLYLSYFPVSCSNTEFAIWVRSFVASALECEGVVYFCANFMDLVLCAIGSLLFWII